MSSGTMFTFVVLPGATVGAVEFVFNKLVLPSTKSLIAFIAGLAAAFFVLPFWMAASGWMLIGIAISLLLLAGSIIAIIANKDAERRITLLANELASGSNGEAVIGYSDLASEERFGAEEPDVIFRKLQQKGLIPTYITLDVDR